MRQSIIATIKGLIQKKFSLKTIFVFLVLILLVQKCNNWQKFDVQSTDSKYEWENRDNYSFYRECRIRFKDYHKNIYNYKTLTRLATNEKKLGNLVSFKISRMPFRCLISGDAHYIVNDYVSENWFMKKNFHLRDMDESLDYSMVLEKYNLDKNNISEIDQLMRKTNIEVLNRDSGYIELCWESAIDDSSLDWYSGYLIVENKDIYESIEHNYRIISRIDDNCYYFRRDVKRED